MSPAGSGFSLSVVATGHTISAVPRFQPPPRRTQHADFPHCALLFATSTYLRSASFAIRVAVSSPTLFPVRFATMSATRRQCAGVRPA